MNRYRDVENFMDYIDKNLDNREYKHGMRGGSGNTQPYETFASIYDNMFSYFKFVYDNKEKNVSIHEKSLEDLEKQCDCEKYKCNNKCSENYTDNTDDNSESRVILSNDNEKEEGENENEKEKEGDEEKGTKLLLKGDFLE